MRILFVHDYGTPHGGAELTVLSLRDGLRRLGHDVRFFASTAVQQPMENVADYTCFGTTGLPRRVLQVVNPWAAHRLSAVLREFQPDIVHVRMFYMQLSPLILPPLRGWRSVLHLATYDLICPLSTRTLPDGSRCGHRQGMACYRAGCIPLAGVPGVLVRDRLRSKWQEAFNVVIANSRWTAQRLRAEGIHVDEAIWNGVPECAARRPLSDPPTVAFAGRLVPEKGVDVLLRAMAQVNRVLPGAQLLVAGEGPQRAALERQSEALGIGSRVKFLGFRPRHELPVLLGGAWVQAVPSRWDEPFGLVAAESMMRGTGVVVSAAGGLAEQVVDGETGSVVAPGDADALAAALLRLLLDRGHAEEVGRAARRHALAEFSEDRVIGRFAELYERLLERPARRAPDAHLDPVVA
jgi:glycosyltransferase involved in cell wall biosynthesis